MYPPNYAIYHTWVFQVTYVDSEKDLFNRFVQLVKELDPDILVGYEVQMTSWGYLRDRANQLGLQLLSEISRIPCKCMVVMTTTLAPTTTAIVTMATVVTVTTIVAVTTPVVAMKTKCLMVTFLYIYYTVASKPNNIVPSPSNPSHRFAASYTSELKIVGRVVLNLWTIMKYEVETPPFLQSIDHTPYWNCLHIT